MVDAVLYVVKTSCQWRQSPTDSPPWLSVHQQFRAWRNDGTWERVTKTLRGQGRKAQGAKCYAKRGRRRFETGQNGLKRGRSGCDAGEKIKGRKRHIAVDTQGKLLTAVVHSADIQDRVGARAVLMRLFCRFDTIVKVFVDSGYTGTLIEWAKQMFGYQVEVVKRSELHQFKILPKSWIIARTLAWQSWSRRLSKDCELRHTSAQTTPNLIPNATILFVASS
jgi:putative transposase